MTTENGNGEYSLASLSYLAPIKDTQDATLRITCTQNAKHFIAEVFNEKVQTLTYVDPADKQTKQREIVHCIPPYSYRAGDFVPDRFKHGHRVINRKDVLHPIYEIPITDYSIALIQKAWTGKKVISEMAKPFFNKIFLREFQAEQNAKRTALYKQANNNAIQAKKNNPDLTEEEFQAIVNKGVPTSDWHTAHDKLLLENGITLNAYQKVASFNACMSRSYGFFCDPGTGKTAMMIRKLDYVIDHANRQTITLVVCPKNVRTNWINEINKFSMHGESGTQKIFIVTLNGTNPTDRTVNFINDLGKDEAQGKHIVIITGYESFVQTPRMQQLEFDLLLADESHNFANPSTKRVKTFLEIRNKFNNVVIATGTPFRNTPFDGYAQLELMGEGYSGFDSFNAFKQFYGIYIQANHYSKMAKLDGFQNIPLLQEKLARHAFIIRKEEALPHLPKKTFSLLECTLSKQQLEVYLQLANQLAAEIESYGEEPDSITVNNILTQMLRLAQITSGFAATDAGTISRFDPNPKLELLVKHLLGTTSTDDDESGSSEELGTLTDPNAKTIVWCAFKENLKMIHARLKIEGIESVMFHGSTDDKDDVVAQYNCDPKTRVFIGIAASGGVGLNLVGFDPYKPQHYTTNTTNLVHYSQNWSSVNYLQANDRAHRHNTRVPVHITSLIVPNSIDVEIFKRVEGKVKMSTGLQDIRRILTAMIPTVNGR